MLRYSDHQIGRGPAFLRQACSFKLEGIVSKRRTEPYRPGRSRSWLKVKCRNREEFVIIGFTDPEGSREGFGALLVGYYDPQGKLRYAGRVGTGFNTGQLIELHQRLESLARPDPTVPCPKGSRAKACIGSSRASSPRSNSPTGRRMQFCAKPRSRACARTRTPETWFMIRKHEPLWSPPPSPRKPRRGPSKPRQRRRKPTRTAARPRRKRAYSRGSG